ncbi:MAG TPA: molecular chaperone Skp, partial [Methylophilaceae bacterium]|nr:molecular chaperone Skp [Methylophilaceae bacterium]
LKEKEAAFSKDALTMKDSDRDAKDKALSQLRVDVQRKERELREDINIRRNEELGGLQEQINKAVTSVAKAENFDLVLYNGVAYASEKIDITDKILKSLGKK